MRTTKYHNTFIAVAESSKKIVGIIPPSNPQPTIAQLTYKIVSDNPYQYTSDDILLAVHRQRNGDIGIQEHQRKHQACFG